MSTNMNQNRKPNYMILLVALGVTAAIVVAVIVVYSFAQGQSDRANVANAFAIEKIKSDCRILFSATYNQCVEDEMKYQTRIGVIKTQ